MCACMNMYVSVCVSVCVCVCACMWTARFSFSVEKEMLYVKVLQIKAAITRPPCTHWK